MLAPSSRTSASLGPPGGTSIGRVNGDPESGEAESEEAESEEAESEEAGRWAGA
jgi:hypothetical protein